MLITQEELAITRGSKEVTLPCAVFGIGGDGLAAVLQLILRATIELVRKMIAETKPQV